MLQAQPADVGGPPPESAADVEARRGLVGVLYNLPGLWAERYDQEAQKDLGGVMYEDGWCEDPDNPTSSEIRKAAENVFRCSENITRVEEQPNTCYDLVYFPSDRVLPHYQVGFSGIDGEWTGGVVRFGRYGPKWGDVHELLIPLGAA